ncbi:MAG: glycoside hydrolase family 3 C-terminal domain-containing protein [Propionibacteriaceae bacterium]|jgi:beta-glucosidase|nr:glycoside hydrolase family 3 C-terminal domain-containing protein [Propionibacteriaceae bacterium]
MNQYPYQDASLPAEQRAEDLLQRLSLEDKAGLMFQAMTSYTTLEQGDDVMGIEPLRDMVEKRKMNHFNITGSASTAREAAEFNNQAQQIAKESGWGIPITFSSDPRHAFTDNPLTSMLAGPFSQWPETLGLAALHDPEAVRNFADIARQEYVAVGMREALHPQIDLATEPRWARTNGTFGEDAELTSQLGAAYIKGLQQEHFGPGSVSAMAKHFPGGGPQKDGEDPHFEYGKDQVYPGNNQEYHLKPFLAAIDAGVRQMMPYYGKPVGTEWEEVGFGFNRDVLTGLLREKLGFQGIICTDWGLLTDVEMMGDPFPARAWGVENLSREERLLKSLYAGADQFGGEMCVEVLIDVVKSGKVPEARLDESVRRLLNEKFLLGLFDDPFVDATAAQQIVGCDEFREAGMRAQSESVVVLENKEGAARLPIAPGIKVYLEGMSSQVLPTGVRPVIDPSQADVAIIRTKAPFEPRPGGFESMFHAGSLEFPEKDLEHIRSVAEAVPTLVDVYLDRPAILGPIPELAGALTVSFGTSDQAYADAIFGKVTPKGRLPFDLPSSMAAVEASREDMPFDTANPLYHFGDGQVVAAA